MPGRRPLLFLLLFVVIAVSTTGHSIVDLKISRTNASREVISGRRSLAVAVDRPACLIVAYDKIKGHLNWMQVRSKRRTLSIVCEAHTGLSIAGLVSEGGQRAV
jgi:hypothetical protein